MVHLDIEDDDTYEVEEILNHRTTANGLEYEVKWKGYDDNDNEWIHESQMDSEQLISEYFKRVKKRGDRLSQKNDGLNRASGINRRRKTSRMSESEKETMPTSSSKRTNSECSVHRNPSQSSNTDKTVTNSKQRRRAMVISNPLKNTPTSSKSKQKTARIEGEVPIAPNFIENQCDEMPSSSKNVETLVTATMANEFEKTQTVIDTPRNLKIRGRKEDTDKTSKIVGTPQTSSSKQSGIISQPEKEKSTIRPTLLIENNELPTNVQKRRHRKLRTPPPLPTRNKPNKTVNENNETTSNCSSRSETPLNSVTTRGKRNETPLVEAVKDISINGDRVNVGEEMKVINIEGEREDSIFEDMIESNPNSVEEKIIVTEREEEEEVAYEDTISALEKGFRVSQILRMGEQDDIMFALLQYTDYDVCEWVDISILKRIDPQILIQYFESTYRRQHDI